MNADEAATDAFVDQQTLRMVLAWRPRLFLATWVGKLGRLILVEARAVTVLVALVPASVFAFRAEWDAAAIAAGIWLAGLLACAAYAAHDRFIIGEFKDSANALKDGAAFASQQVNLANLLSVEISRLSDLFKVVGNRRAVSSGLTHQRGLEATLSVDSLVENLQGTISSEAKATIGPITIPLAPFVTLFGKLLQSPRLTGNLHRDGQVLILTAQTSGRGSLSWRVQRSSPPPQPGSDEVEAVVSGMVEELALRIYTDLALGRAVRWESSKSFVDGLHRFRACLRTPKDRKVNLKHAEVLFLNALAEDEDFPLVYYNLGVVYTELHGLAVSSGRKREAEAHLSAAETCFGRAIQRDPARWENYFAFAQTQFRHERYESVLELCAQIVELKLGRADQAKANELWARALLERDRPEEYREAVEHALRASRLALRSLARARLIRRPSPRGEDDPASRCEELATGCLLTLTDVYSRRMRVAGQGAPGRRRLGRRDRDRIRRRLKWLVELAPMTRGKAELHFDFGQRALADEHFNIAEEELGAATRSDPTRPSYAAGLALALAKRLTSDKRQADENERNRIIGLCLRALQGMAGAFFPSRDADACRIVADVYDEIGSEEHGDHQTASELRAIAVEVDERLAGSVSGVSVSGIFLEVLQSSETELKSKIGAYAETAQQARTRLAEGRELSTQGDREAAATKFRQALEHAERAAGLNPLSTLAWETLGDVHRELSDFQNARSAWEHALGTDPDNPSLYNKIGSSYWHIAYQARARASPEVLQHAAEHFDKALRLYGSGGLEAQTLTHYRLGKLNAALRQFGEARRHLEIVEAVEGPPVVGWAFLGFAHLEQRNFTESEYYFGQVVKEGERRRSLPADLVIGDRLDEQLWPLGLIRAWGHLGLAITITERDGHFPAAHSHLNAATALLKDLGLDPEDPASDERFPTRAVAAILECRGLAYLREGKREDAITQLEDAIRQFPYSRSYLELALALEQRVIAREETSAETRQETVARALRMLDHAISLRGSDEPSVPIRQAMERLRRLSEEEAAR